MSEVSWSTEDEARLALLEKISPPAAQNIRIAIGQAREQHRRAVAESRKWKILVEDSRFLQSIGVWPW